MNPVVYEKALKLLENWGVEKDVHHTALN